MVTGEELYAQYQHVDGARGDWEDLEPAEREAWSFTAAFVEERRSEAWDDGYSCGANNAG